MKAQFGLDTNILISWLLSGGDTPRLSEPKYRISLVVLAELSWVLKSSFRNDKSQIIATIRLILESTKFEFVDRGLIEQSLIDFENGKAGFADFLLMNDNLSSGCDATLTFDKNASRNSGFVLVKVR